MKFLNLLNLKWIVLMTLVTSLGVTKIHHEHISTVPGYEDYVYAFKQLGSDIGRIKLEKLSEDPVKSIGEIFGQDVVADMKARLGIAGTDKLVTDPLLTEKIKPMTFREIAGLVRVSLKAKGFTDVSNNEVMKSCFEYTRLNDANRGDWSYMSMGWDFRLYAQDMLMEAKGGAVHLFKHFLLRTPVEHRTVVSITANAFHEFFKPENAKVMAEIRSEFDRAGSQLEWIGGVTRAQVQKFDPKLEDVHSAFKDNMTKFSELLGQGQISGMDITGSIVEGSKKYMDLEDRAESNLFERLQIIMDMLSKPTAPGQLKIHMYESTGDGEFYDIFFNALKDQIAKKGPAAIPPIIRIGHVNALRAQDIKRFEELPEIKDRFVFEANLDSNMNLKHASAEKIAGIINRLIAVGFNVRLGTDGLGIFGKVAYFDSVIARLQAGGLSEKAIQHLKQFSDQPVYNSQNYNRFGSQLKCLSVYR
ncbi:MAG: hypothetical protein JNM24_05135 [Bdellovibrionaceae bacterium]|nr:hypothetical protein [Pseudobdellovibrionaceae bacterium]